VHPVSQKLKTAFQKFEKFEIIFFATYYFDTYSCNFLWKNMIVCAGK
jgi:hypothetical protein